MPRYFLNVRDRSILMTDPDGDEAPDLPAIRRIAEACIADIYARPHAYGEARLWDRRSLEITDETGTTVLVVPFSEHPAKY